MFQGFFAWLRNRVKQAVVAGVQEAMDELATAKVQDAPAEPQLLTFKESETPAKRRKAE